jgi:hypothetical protein
MTTPKITKECLQDKEAVKATWAWEKPALDGVFDALYKNYKDGKTPEVLPAERTALIELAEAANKTFGLGIEPEKFAKIVIDCLPADLPALPKEFDIVKDAQKAGVGSSRSTLAARAERDAAEAERDAAKAQLAMVPHIPPSTTGIMALASIVIHPEATPLAIIPFLAGHKPGTRTFYFVHTASMVLSMFLFWMVHSMLYDFYFTLQRISPVLMSVADNMLVTLNMEEQGYVRFIFSMISEVCGMGYRFNEGTLQTSDAHTALEGLANAGRLLVDIVQDAGGSYFANANLVCTASPDDTSAMGIAKNLAGAWAQGPNFSRCVRKEIKASIHREKQMVESKVGSTFGQIRLIVKIAAVCGTTSSLALAADLGLKVPAFIGRRLAAARGNQLALEGGKKSRRKSRKKTKKRVHKKQRKSRKKTGHRSRKAGSRSRKAGRGKRR